jgi:hypothetical protein
MCFIRAKGQKGRKLLPNKKPERYEQEISDLECTIMPYIENI